MRRVELVSLHLRNFKGIRDLRIEFGEGETTIYGANAAGKTSAFDGFTYLLFEKDSSGAKAFDIKTLTPEGKALSGLEHEVEGVFRVDDVELVLQRTYREVWTKKRGSPVAEFTGHETVHHVDGVPVTKGEYTAKVAEISDESTWRLLSDPAAWQSLHWQERRRTLLEICGDLTDQEVIESDTSLSDLPGILGKRSIDEHRKVVVSRRSELNREIQELPVRISEVKRGMTDLPDVTPSQLESVLKSTREQRAAVGEQIAAAKAGGSDAAAERKRLREVEDELSTLERDASRAADDAALVQRRELLQAQQAVIEVKAELKQAHASMDETARLLSAAQDDDARLRREWAEANARTFLAVHSEDTCAACGQALPADQVQAAHAKAQAEFNAAKAKDLERIVAAGKRAANAVADHTDANARADAKATELEKKLELAQAHVEKIENAPAKKTVDVTSTKAYTVLAKERDDLSHKIAKLTEGDTSAIDELQAEAERLDALITDFQADQARHEQAATAGKRIEELKEREGLLTSEFETFEHQLFLMDEFTRTKVAMLEDRVAAKFERVAFRLFKTQVNGGLEECCDATVDGVPFESVNRAGQIQAGLDIIKTLQAHHGLAAPVWVDGRESVTQLPDMDCQVISLVVSPADATLRVETAQLEAVA